MKLKTKNIYVLQLLFGILGLVFVVFFMPRITNSFLTGWALSTINFLLLNFFWRRVFEKKHIAMTLLLVITKYAGLAALLYLLVNSNWVHLGGLLFGISTLLLSIITVALLVYIREK